MGIYKILPVAISVILNMHFLAKWTLLLCI